MREDWVELARWLEAQPWNRQGSDKTWVLAAMWEHLRWSREVRRAERLGGA